MIPIIALMLAPAADAQFFNAIRNLFNPVRNVIQGAGNIFNGGGGNFRDDGTQRPKADGQDKLFVDDCGRNTDDGTGKLCFPDGQLCQNRKYNVLIINHTAQQVSLALAYCFWLELRQTNPHDVWSKPSWLKYTSAVFIPEPNN